MSHGLLTRLKCSRRRFAFAVGFAIAVSVFVVPPALAQVNTGIDFGTSTGLTTVDIRITVARIIRAFLGLLGVVGLGIVLTGGFLWMTSGGNEEKITQAKKLLANGAIGLTIVLLSFSITQFVISRLVAAVGGGGGVTTAGGGIAEEVFLSGALGNGPIERHYPGRGATDIPRNARIFITFREEVDIASLASDTNVNETIGTVGDPTTADNGNDLALPEAIQVVPVGVNVDPAKLTSAAKASDRAAFDAEAAKLTPVGVTTVDRRTFVLTPVAVANGRARVTTQGFPERALLGDGRAPTAYLVRLTSAITRTTRRSDGTPEPLFTGAFREGYTWDFTVSTVTDRTPPRIVRVVPVPDAARDADGAIIGARDQPRNVVIQMTFDDAMDPTVVSGSFATGDAARAFAHLGVSTDGTAAGQLDGTFTVSNAYRTVEFTTPQPCARNTCGGDVYCLPGNAELTVWADAATLDAGGPEGVLFSGVMDAAGNSLDGNGNGRAEGPVSRYDRTSESPTGGDSTQWRFQTNDTLDLTAPRIVEIVHYGREDDAPRQYAANVADVSNVSATRPVEVLFSKLMLGEAAGGVHLTEADGCNPATGAGCLWYEGSLRHEDTSDTDAAVDATRVTVAHAPLREARSGMPVPEYRVRVDSTIRDIYQNCFFSREDPEGPQGPSGGERCIVQPGSEQCEPT